MELNDDNTDLITKCKIIMEFAYQESENPQWEEWFDRNDLGVPISLLYSNNMIELKDLGAVCVQETWLALCKSTMADARGTYKTLEDMLLKFDPVIEDDDEE